MSFWGVIKPTANAMHRVAFSFPILDY